MTIIMRIAVFNSLSKKLFNSNSPISNFQKRKINLDKLSNKRITRLESDIELEHPLYKSRIINRNPRNLEQLSYEKKPSGFWFEKSPPQSWNKLVFERNGNQLDAYLQHWSGKKLVTASTKEPQLSKYFKSASSTQAAIILAKVISRRCLQSGFLYAGANDYTDDENASIKSRCFYETVEASGLALKEPPEITPRCVSDL